MQRAEFLALCCSAILSSSAAHAQFEVTNLPDGGGFVRAVSQGVQDARKAGKVPPTKGRSSAQFYALQLGMKAEDVVRLLGLPEKQKVYEHLTPLVGTDKLAYRRFVCFGYDGVGAFPRTETWRVVFDESGLRGWGASLIDGC